VSKELDLLHMLDRYKAHLTGLKELQAVAPRCFIRLKWIQYIKEVIFNTCTFTTSNKNYTRDYSSTSFIRTCGRQDVTDRSELHLDGPVPKLDINIADYQCKDQMMEEVQIASLTSQEEYVREFVDGLCAPTLTVPSHAPSLTPAAEFDEDRRLTARSNGKGCTTYTTPSSP
jgi:hypothetical protein